MNLVRLITIGIIYSIFSFAEWDWNVGHWGNFARFSFIILAIVSAVIWWIIGVVTTKDEKETPKTKSSFQERMEKMAEERKEKK